jgi:hypothetical protein
LMHFQPCLYWSPSCRVIAQRWYNGFIITLRIFVDFTTKRSCDVENGTSVHRTGSVGSSECWISLEPVPRLYWIDRKCSKIRIWAVATMMEIDLEVNVAVTYDTDIL